MNLKYNDSNKIIIKDGIVYLNDRRIGFFYTIEENDKINNVLLHLNKIINNSNSK